MYDNYLSRAEGREVVVLKEGGLLEGTVGGEELLEDPQARGGGLFERGDCWREGDCCKEKRVYRYLLFFNEKLEICKNNFFFPVLNKC